MEMPKPGPRESAMEAVKNLGATAEEATENIQKFVQAVKKTQEKPVYVRKPHLTHRPFVNPDLVNLRKGMTKPNRNNGKKK